MNQIIRFASHRFQGIAGRSNANIECPILMTLRFIYFKTSEPQNFEEWFRFAQSF